MGRQVQKWPARLMSQNEGLQSSLYSLILIAVRSEGKKEETLVLQYSVSPMEGIRRGSNGCSTDKKIISQPSNTMCFIKPWSWDRGKGKGWGWKNMDSEGRKSYSAKACSPIWPPGLGTQVGVWVSRVHCPCFPGPWLLLHPENCNEGTSKVLKSARDCFKSWEKSAI